MLSTQSGRLQLSTQRDRGVQILALHIHVHEVGPHCARAAAVPRTEGAVAAAAWRGAQGPGQRTQLPGSYPDRRGPWTGGELQSLGPLRGANGAIRIQVGYRRGGSFAAMGD